MRWAISFLLIVHGLIHLLGFAKSIGLAELPEIQSAISVRAGRLWLMAATGLMASSVMVFASPRAWWAVAIVSVVASQIAILGSWSDARAGTLPNLIVLAAALYGFSSQGPFSFQAEYRRAVSLPPISGAPPEPIDGDDLAHLPPPVRRYLELAGAIGQPRVTHFQATWKGRIRESLDDPWMEFTAKQYNTVSPHSRFFSMDARKSGMPVDVLHTYQGGIATMRVKLLSAIPLVTVGGPDFTRGETVTLLNDLCILAPAALLDDAIGWEVIDDRTARVTFTAGEHTIRAVLSFNEAGELVDFVSDDRVVTSEGGKEISPQRWSTPVGDYASFGPWWAPRRGQGMWHSDNEPAFTYIELELLTLSVNGGISVGPRPPEWTQREW